MKPPLQRILFSLAILVWAAVLIYFLASGRIAKYLAPDFRSYVMVGGLGLAVLGLFNLLTATQQASCGHDHAPDEPHDHESLDVHPFIAFLVLVVPIGLAMGWTRDGFSMGTLTRKGVLDSSAERTASLASMMPKQLTREIIEKQHPADAAGYHEFGLMELFFSGGDPEIRELVDGMLVETEGRLVTDPNGLPNQRRLYRLFITCCAADSRAIPIIVRFQDEVPKVKENAWMKLSGTMRYPDEGEGPVPVLEVAHAEEGTAPPEEAFTRGGF